MAERLFFPPSGPVPNSALPVLLHRGSLAAGDGAASYEARFARHGWANAWRNGVYPFHHFHSTAHEVLGICGGRATLRLGGEGGRDVEVAAGDVVVLPAGTGHRRLSASPDFRVVGAYPDGRGWDLVRAEEASEADLRAARTNIAAVPMPARDPATGMPMADVWGR